MTVPDSCDDVVAPGAARRTYSALKACGCARGGRGAFRSRADARRAVTVHVSREGGWWLIDILEVDGLTQARRLSRVADRARSYLEVDQDAHGVEVNVVLADIGAVTGLDERRRALAAARERGEAGLAEANRLAVALARELVDEGIPLPDIETVLGLRNSGWGDAEGSTQSAAG